MENGRDYRPVMRLLFVLMAVIMLFFLPTRELKVTFIIGIPFVFVMRIMGRQYRYALGWWICGFILIAIIAGYGFSLYHLPERIQVRQLVTEGETLLANGEYQKAIECFEKLEGLGQKEQASERIAQARLEEEANQQLEEARLLIAKGDEKGAYELMRTIPDGTRAAMKAHKLLKLQAKP